MVPCFATRAQRAELTRQQTPVTSQQDRLLSMRLADEIDQDAFAKKHTELRDRLAGLKVSLDAIDRSHDEMAELAAKVFELSQTLRKQWLTADYAAERRLLEIVLLNCRLDDGTLVPTMRRAFDVLAEGLLVPSSRGDRRCTFRNDLSPTALLHTAIAKSQAFSAAEFWRLANP